MRIGFKEVCVNETGKEEKKRDSLINLLRRKFPGFTFLYIFALTMMKEVPQTVPCL